MSLDEMWKRFYRDEGFSSDVVERALKAIEDATGVSAGKLRPGDRFDLELAPPAGWELDDGLAELGWYLKGLGAAERSQIRTVADFIREVQHLAAYPATQSGSLGTSGRSTPTSSATQPADRAKGKS